MRNTIRRVCSFLILASATGRIVALDKARVETRVDDAVAKFGVSGKGVIYALLDRGIDWQNNDFRNADGTTRIAYIFDLTDDTGANARGNSYSAGTIYTRDQINQALQGGAALATRDAIGHGTANTAIGAGNGRNSNGKYRGIAPQATIIAVKLVSDGAAAHGDQPAEAAFYKPDRIPIAIDFVRDKALELGMPCVMVLDIGSQGGPTDGSSSQTRKIDATAGSVPGLAIIPGAGDDGGRPNRAGGSVPAGGSVDLKIQKGVAGGLVLDLWYAGSDRFDVTVRTPDTTYGPFVAPANDATDSRTNLGEVVYYHYGSASNGWGSTSGKRELYIQINGPVGTYTISLSGATVASGHFDATINPSQEWNSSTANVFLNFVAPGSISDLGSARNAIVDACSVVRTTWIDIDGITRTQTGVGEPGDLWLGTSAGPTFDGRLGIDVAAPANNIITAYAPKSIWATSRFNLINDGKGLYGLGGGNSSSNPVLAGIVALMFELNPRLDALTIKGILQKSARADSFTGIVPNPKWGYGKVDALAALTLVAGLSPTNPVTTLVANAEGDVPLIAPNTWVEIKGANLAPAGDARIWQGSDFPVNQLPTQLDGVSVTVNGESAYIYYISPNQVNILTPPDAMPTAVQVKLTNAGVSSAASTVAAQPVAPSFFIFNGGPYVTGEHADGSFLGPATLYPGLTTPAKPGETVLLFANGFGPTSVQVISGALTQSGTLSPLPVVTIGGVPATVAFAGLVGPGEFQFNVVVPLSVADGDQPITATYNGSSTQPGTLITILR